MSEPEIPDTSRRRRTFLTLIWIGVLGLAWLLLAPAQLFPSPSVRTSPNDDTRVTCNAVLFAGPSRHLNDEYDGVATRDRRTPEAAAAHSACDGLRDRRLGWSVLLAIPVTVLAVRLPPGRPTSARRSSLKPSPSPSPVHPFGPMP